jgi:hypothetical protein
MSYLAEYSIVPNCPLLEAFDFLVGCWMGLAFVEAFFVGKVIDFELSATSFFLVLLTLGFSAPSKGLEGLRARVSQELSPGIRKSVN